MNKRKSAEQAAIEIISKLRAEGHVALLAGGCVRDRLLGRIPKDFDVVTNATPQRVKEIFPKARGVGAKFGVMLVRRGGHDIEVATFRSDGDYSDGRRPDDVTFGSEEEDALRRDFTINGLFFDPIDDRVIDYVGGRQDIESGIIRTIGDPDRRLAEDHLRLLRAVRFSARFDFTIDPSTLDAIKRHAHHLTTISAERIWMELELILCDPSRARGWAILNETGVRAFLSPNWPVDEAADRLEQRRLEALRQRPDQPDQVNVALPLACVLRSLTPGDAARVCRSLRQSNRLIDAVVWLLKSLAPVRNVDALDLADLKLLMANPGWTQLLEFLRVDLIALHEDQTAHQVAVGRAAKIPADEIAPEPFVTGNDLREMGIPPGPKLGEILSTLYRAQLNGTIKNRDEAIRKVGKMNPTG